MRLKDLVVVAAVFAALGALTTPSTAGVSKVEGGIEFTYEDPSAGSVSLAGDFNNWNMNADKLTQGDDGVWRIVVDLSPGEYEYKFVVNGSEWIADPENPRVVGSYGNSGLTINEDGEPVIDLAGVEAISNTSVNSRVRLNGWYRATYDTRSDVQRDPRWRLSRPAHEMYIRVNPTVTDLASGSATLYVSTGTGDIREITADIYSGHATLEGGPFTATGFYNEELVQYDDPLETVGHRDLALTIPEEHIPFGRGAQGLILEAEFWDFSLNATYANVYDYELMNDPGIYDNTETDLLAARLKRDVGPVTLGATYTSWRDGWWIDWTGTNSSPDIDEFRQEHPESQSDWFELARTESWLGLDASGSPLAGLLDVAAEVARYSFDSRFDMGNKEKVEGEDYSNGAIDVPVGDTEGWVGRIILDATPIQPLDLRFEATVTAVDSMSSDELYVTFGETYWASVRQGEYTEVKYDGSPLSVNVFGPAPERDELEFEFDAGLTFGIFQLGMEYDADRYEWTYVEPLDTHWGPMETYEFNQSRIAAVVGASVSERISARLAFESITAQYDDDTPFRDATVRQLILGGEIGLWEQWKLMLDVRSASYGDFVRLDTSQPDSVDYDDGTFVAPYVAMVYEPRENVEIRVGYGVNPLSYDDAPVEGRPNGRERWMSQYLWEHSELDWLDAEEALEDARTIGVMAVITF
jgi:hypothetical protein